MKNPRDALARVLEVLDLLEIHYMVGGSMATSTHGISRPTLDIDLVVDLDPAKVNEFVRELQDDFYADAGMIREALDRGRSFNLIHYETTYKFDFFPLRNDPFSQTEFGRRVFVGSRIFGDEPIECAMSTPEDIVLRKLLWYRMGGETSERQWTDMQGVIDLRRHSLDIGYLREWAARLKVDDLLTKLI